MSLVQSAGAWELPCTSSRLTDGPESVVQWDRRHMHGWDAAAVQAGQRQPSDTTPLTDGPVQADGCGHRMSRAEQGCTRAWVPTVWHQACMAPQMPQPHDPVRADSDSAAPSPGWAVAGCAQLASSAGPHPQHCRKHLAAMTQVGQKQGDASRSRAVRTWRWLVVCRTRVRLQGNLCTGS